MLIEIKDIDRQIIADLFPSCNSCLYWEDPAKFGWNGGGEPRVPVDEAVAIKRAWFDEVGEKFGVCGQMLYADGKAVGYAQYAPPEFLEYVAEFAQAVSPPDPDGILLSCLHIRHGYQGEGLGTKLLQQVLADLRKRGCKVIETYSRDDSIVSASGPTVLYLENAFRKLMTERWGYGTFSLMRLEL